MLTDQDRDEENEDDVEEDKDSDSEQEDDQKDILDMPPPWSPKLYIDWDKYLNLCPNGEKTVFYKKVRVDQFSRNS